MNFSTYLIMFGIICMTIGSIVILIEVFVIHLWFFHIDEVMKIYFLGGVLLSGGFYFRGQEERELKI